MDKVEDDLIKKAEEELNELFKKYQEYMTERLKLEQEFEKKIGALREKIVQSGADDELAGTIAERGKALMKKDYEILTTNPEYTRAMLNLKNTSDETLGLLLEQLMKYKEDAATILDNEKLKAYLESVQKIIDEFVSRNPFKALASAQKALGKSNEALVTAKKELSKAEESGDPEKIIEAQGRYRGALDGVAEASNRVKTVQNEVNTQIIGLYDALSNVGTAIGGTPGKIISFIADIGKFVSTTINGIKAVNKTGADSLSALEKASVILGIIQAAILILNKLNELLPDTHEQYKKYAEKVGEINKMRDAVNEYEIAVLKAKQAEDNWFGKNNLRSLRDAWQINEQATSAYFEKLREQQAVYQNEAAGGLLRKIIIPTTMLAHGDLTGAIGTFWGSQKKNEYDEQTIQAKDNLRIETRKKSNGFLGIGGKSQQTENLQEWIKQQDELKGMGELFDEEGLINKELAQTLVDKYGDKLVGQTKETLEALIALRTQSDEYFKQLHSVVSSLYEPLVDNLVNSLWANFDSGKDALDSFKEYASKTFRNILSDMMRTLVFEKVIGTFSDDITALYDNYAKGTIDEAALMDEVSKRTNRLMDDYTSNLPALQEIMNTVAGSLGSIGLDLKQAGDKDAEASDNTLKGAYAKASQESIDLLAGQTGAARVALEDIRRMMIEESSPEKNEYYMSLQHGLNSMIEIQRSGWNEVAVIRDLSRQVVNNTETLTQLSQSIATSNSDIAVGVSNTAKDLSMIVNNGIKLKSTGLGT